jgi:hypothetical protein
VNDFVEAGVLELFARLSPWFARLRSSVGDAVRPPRDVEVRTADGSLITGIIIVDQGHIIAMVAMRQYVPRRPNVNWPDDPTSWGDSWH